MERNGVPCNSVTFEGGMVDRLQLLDQIISSTVEIDDFYELARGNYKAVGWDRKVGYLCEMMVCLFGLA